MSRNEYLQVDVPSGKALILTSKIKELNGIDAIFFDCDGVLIDVRESYDATVIETVRFLAQRLMDISVSSPLPLQKAILELKKSGGFNNDWCVSYALLLGLYCYVHDNKELEPLKLEQNCSEKIVHLGMKADPTGIRSVERTLNYEGYEASVKSAKELLGYPVESSIVGRVFDEIFYGRKLFSQKFEVEPEFYNGSGFVNMETTAVSQDTLNRLIAFVGKDKIGIVSGRDTFSAAKTLGSLIKIFQSKNLYFLMENPKYDDQGKKSTEPLVSKPNPEILIKAVKNLNNIHCCLYVGDSAEDLIMVQRANEIVPRFAFAGVYNLRNFKDEMRSYFLENGADVILPSVNDLPELMNLLGE